MSRPFEQELATYGPQAATPAPGAAEAEEYCRRLARTHYENFPVASWLLPRRLHQHFFNVYAFCRWADDLGDEVGDPARSLELLAWWREELAACFAGRARHPVYVALARTIAACRLPRAPFEDLISAFEQDQRMRRYETFAELADYCRRSANPVGRLVLHLFGTYSEANAAWSDSICTGLQLANFWQDVARDFERGRCYLPAEDRRRFGYTEEDLRERVTNTAFIELMRFEVDRAREFLTGGLPLVGRAPARARSVDSAAGSRAHLPTLPTAVPPLPLRLRWEIELFLRGGLRILDRIERIGYRVWRVRPVLTRMDFAALLLKSLLLVPCAAASTRHLFAVREQAASAGKRLTTEQGPRTTNQ